MVRQPPVWLIARPPRACSHHPLLLLSVCAVLHRSMPDERTRDYELGRPPCGVVRTHSMCAAAPPRGSAVRHPLLVAAGDLEGIVGDRRVLVHGRAADAAVDARWSRTKWRAADLCAWRRL